MNFFILNLISVLRWIYSVSGFDTGETGDDCYDLDTDNSAAYIGSETYTINGIQCQRWDSQFPHKHHFIRDDMFPEMTVSDASNFCRDPGKYGFPWCFTVKQNIRWDTCGIFPCRGEGCYYEISGYAIYSGVKSVNKGSICQRWDVQSPHTHSFTVPGLFNVKRLSDVANYCRDPDGTGVPWCFSTDLSQHSRLPCVVPRCRECFTMMDNSAWYYGIKDVSRSGRKCQRWDSIKVPGYSYPYDAFPDNSLSIAKYFCRDPDGSGETWCYTEKNTPVREACDVKPCPETDCYIKVNNTIVYEGSVSSTVLGYECQRWDKDFPHVNYYKRRRNYPEGSISKSSNYCRDPSKGGFLWCYTTDTKKRWDKCAVRACKDLECYFKVESRVLYPGTISTTKNGDTCQNWGSGYPHNHVYILSARLNTDRTGLFKNYCRDPSHDGYLWCYTTNPKVRWGKCDVPACPAR